MTTRRVSPQEAHDLVQNQGYVYVDVRSVQEFEGGHPAGAYNIPIAHPTAAGMQPNPDFLRAMEARFPRDARLVVGCLSGGRSARACSTLEQSGYTDLVDQRAGWGGAKDSYGRLSEPGWSAAGLPSAVGPDADRGYTPPT